MNVRVEPVVLAIKGVGEDVLSLFVCGLQSVSAGNCILPPLYSTTLPPSAAGVDEKSTQQFRRHVAQRIRDRIQQYEAPFRCDRGQGWRPPRPGTA